MDNFKTLYEICLELIESWQNGKGELPLAKARSF